MNISLSVDYRQEIQEFAWQHYMLLISLFLMTLGVALNVRSSMGSSVISSIPLAFSMAGADGYVPGMSIGGYTNVMNFILVGLQVAILRRRFEPVQLLQLVIGFLFGMLIDLNMYLTSFLSYDNLISQVLAQFAGCTVMAVGITMEVRCGSVTMPGEGLPIALSLATGMPFAKLKIWVDTALVAGAVVCCYIFWGIWKWNVIGPGTLFAMVYVGYVVKMLSPHMSWFDRMLAYRPGFRRYLYGLARLLYPKSRN